MTTSVTNLDDVVPEVDQNPDDMEELCDEIVVIATDSCKSRYKRNKRKEPFRRGININL